MLKVNDAIEEFLLACRADGLKGESVRWHKSRLKPVRERFGHLPLDQVSRSEMREYIAELYERPTKYINAPQRPETAGALSLHTVRGHIRSLRRFWKWVIHEYEFDPASNPMVNIRMKKSPPYEPKAISHEDFLRLYEVCPKNVQGLRVKAMITFLIDTGCRASGMLNLEIANLALDDGVAVVTEKGDKTRTVFLSYETITLLQQWLKVRPSEGTTVFCSLRKSTLGMPLSLTGLHMILRRLSELVKIEGRINPHSFRHRFAIDYLNNGGDASSLAEILGHSDVSVTLKYYARFVKSELKQKHQKAGPLNKVKGLLSDAMRRLDAKNRSF